MKNIIVQKIIQHESECYIGKIDPRELVRVATKVEMSAVQDAQRPLNEKRVKDIAKYVGTETGLLPNTLTLATKDTRLNVVPYDSTKGLFSISFPESDEEYSRFSDAIDVMDGQHRLYSFSDEIRLLSDDADYQIGFTLFILPSLDERRKIFISCNEKQEKVSGNLLMWLKAQINLLTDDEKFYFEVISKLSTNYPLKDHIIMNAEKIKNGVKAKEVAAALKKSKIQDIAINGTVLTEDQMVKVLCTYLTAWEKVIGFSFSSSSKRLAGAAITMAGLKYMLLLLPAIWDKAVADQKKFDNAFVEDTLKRFISACGVERENFFICDEHKMCFRDRTAVELFASQSIIKIKSLVSENFNPLG